MDLERDDSTVCCGTGFDVDSGVDFGVDFGADFAQLLHSKRGLAHAQSPRCGTDPLECATRFGLWFSRPRAGAEAADNFHLVHPTSVHAEAAPHGEDEV